MRDGEEQRGGKGQKEGKAEGKALKETAAVPKHDFSSLTRQEKCVAELIERGLTNREIGEELCISEATVKKHVSSIFEKLGIRSRKELR